MKHIPHKLRSERGASLLMALLLVFVAVMVSAVVISAALTASHRICDDFAFEQSYQTVTSAASVVKTAIENAEVKYTVRRNIGTNEMSESWTASGGFGEELKDFLKNDAGFPEILSDPVFFSGRSRSYTVAADDFHDVNVEMSISYDDVNDKYKLEMECSEADDYTSSHIAAVTLDMLVTVGPTDTRTVEGVVEEVAETTFTWTAN